MRTYISLVLRTRPCKGLSSDFQHQTNDAGASARCCSGEYAVRHRETSKEINEEIGLDVCQIAAYVSAGPQTACTSPHKLQESEKDCPRETISVGAAAASQNEHVL